MDQLKTALAWLKQYHFWLLVVLAVGAALGGWYSGASSLASRYETNSKKIDEVFNSINRVSSEAFKPNDGINRRQQDELVKQNEATLAVWQSLYQTQQDKVLIWPKELGPRFIEAVKDKSFGDSIRGEYRELYLNYIEKTFDNLLEIVDAEPIEESGSDGGRGGRGGNFGGAFRGGGPTELDPEGEPVETYLVQWIDQVELRDELDLERIPSNLQLWVLQEDLWVYDTLLKAIATTNRLTNATRSDRAAISVIEELKVGQSAAQLALSDTQSRLVEPDAEVDFSAGGRGGRGGLGGFSERSSGGGDGRFDRYGTGGIGSADATLSDTQSVLLANRYLDETGKPIEEVPENYQFGRGFKLLPIRMRLQMDTRWLSTLMWELANAPLQVEITELRFNPDEASSGGEGRSNNGESLAFNRRPTQGTVVLQGNVYLFNPPEEPDLGVQE